MSTTHKLLLDENLSWRVARDLTRAGYDVLTTAQANLTSLGDHLVFQRAQQLGRVIMTRDSDFRMRFTPPHHGIIVLNCESTVGNREIVDTLLHMLPTVLGADLADMITVIDIP
jgi:predicted nuclease of predicted toxin-antitoxin system